MKTRLLWSMLAITACGYDRVQNDNDGALGALTMSRAAGPFAAGEPITVAIRRQDIGTYHCVDHGGTPSFGSLPGSGPWRDCRYTGEPAPIEAITEAHCDDGQCTTRLVDSGHVELTANAPGAVTLHVDARLKGGVSVSDRWDLPFVKIDRLELRCVNWAECPGPNAIFIGTELALVATAFSGTNLINTAVKSTAEPAEIFELTGGPSQQPGSSGTPLVLRAAKAGVATVHLRGGGFEQTRSFRVVDPADAVRGRVWHIATGADLFEIRNNPLGNLVGDALNVKRYANVSGELTELMVGWEMRDGSLAIGGAKDVTSSVAGFIRPWKRESDGKPGLALLLVNPFIVPSYQRVTLGGRVGTAMMEQSFRIEFTEVP